MIFRYPGGKSRKFIRELILSHAPKTFEEYREPFVGGGGIFFGIAPSKKRWINDMNTHIVAVYLALRDRPQSFIKMCQSIAPAIPGEPSIVSVHGTRYPKRLHDLFHALRDNHNADLALRCFFCNRTGYGGRVVLDGDRIGRTTFSNPRGWNIAATDRLELAAEHLQGAQITCGDYEPLLSTRGDGVYIYCDPPYMRDTALPKSGKLYQHGFTLSDHYRFAEESRKCKHSLCISYDDHPLIRELYKKDFFIYPQSWAYCGTSLKKKKVGQELIITNYPVEPRTNLSVNTNHPTPNGSGHGTPKIIADEDIAADCY